MDGQHHTFHASWSPEDGEYVALVDEFPSVSWLAPQRRRGSRRHREPRRGHSDRHAAGRAVASSVAFLARVANGAWIGDDLLSAPQAFREGVAATEKPVGSWHCQRAGSRRNVSWRQTECNVAPRN